MLCIENEGNEKGTSWVDGDERRRVMQSGFTGWSLDSSEQQKKTLLHPSYFSSSHLMYNNDSIDSFSASYKTIAFKQTTNRDIN